MNYRCEMIRDAQSGSYYVEVHELDCGTDELVFTGRRCPTWVGARRSVMGALAMIFEAARSLSGSAPVGQRVDVIA